MSTATQIPVLVGLKEMVDMFGLKQQTVYRWNAEAADRKRILPEPELVVSGSSLWRLDTILVWAARRDLKIDQTVVRRIKRLQGH